MRHTKGALVALALLFALNAPAYAAGAIITGTGTGGNLATGTSSSAVGTLAITTTVDAPVGSLIVVSASIRSTVGPASACVDNATIPNTYTAVSAGLSNGQASGAQFYSIVATDLPNGGTITCTYGVGTAVRKDMTAVAFSGAVASPLDAASTSGTGSSTNMAIGPTGTLACPSGAAGCEIMVGTTTEVQAGTITESTGYTSLGTQGFMHMGYKITGATTAETYAPQNSSSGAFVGFISGFKSSTGGAAPANKLMFRTTP